MNETTCERIERLISRALDGEATDAERAEASAHAAACASCRETEAAWGRLGEAFGARVAADERQMIAVAARPVRPHVAGGDPRGGLAVGGLITAGLVAVALLAGSVGSRERGEVATRPADPIEATPAVEVAPASERLRVRLAPARADAGVAPREVEVAIAARIERSDGRLVLNLRR